MGIKATIIKPYAKRVSKSMAKWIKNPVDAQSTMAKLLINKAALTQFGKSHNFHKIVTSHNFKEEIPIRSRDSYKSFIESIRAGEKDVVWPGRPRYLIGSQDKSTSHDLVPASREMIPSFFNTMRNVIFQYALQRDDMKFVEGKVVYLPSVNKGTSGVVPVASLSHVVHKNIPAWMSGSLVPDIPTCQIKDDSKRMAKTASQSEGKNVTIIGGSYELLKMYAAEILKGGGADCLKELFPGLRLFVTDASLNADQKTEVQAILGEEVDILSTFILPSGFIAYQDNVKQNGLLLNVSSGMYFEFVPLDTNQTRRLWLDQISMQEPYRLIVNNNAGLWGYDTGVKVKFVNLHPHRIALIDEKGPLVN